MINPCKFYTISIQLVVSYKKIMAGKRQKYLAVPRTASVPVCGRCKLSPDLDPTPVGGHMVLIGPQVHTNESNVTFTGYLTS